MTVHTLQALYCAGVTIAFETRRNLVVADRKCFLRDCFGANRLLTRS